MTARYEITIKFTVVDEVDSAFDLKDIHEISETAAQSVCDSMTGVGMYTTYEIIDRRMDAK